MTRKGLNVNAGDVATVATMWPRSSIRDKESRGGPAGLKGHMYAPIVPEPQHPAPQLRTPRRKDGGTEMKTRFPNDAGTLAVDLAKTGF